jgi:hypothetical protein
MRRSLVTFSSSLAVLSLVSFAGTASAQEAQLVAPPPQQTVVRVAAPAPVAVVETGNDHDEVVGHFAVGYFGISQLPVGTAAGGAGVGQGYISAPVIGVRYWLSQKLGIDVGVGFSDSSAGWGIAAHGGVPLALATSKHMTFELIPEATVAFAGNSPGALPGGGAANSYSGFRLTAGARIGGEIQFGFIGIPQLALQATVGLYLDHDSWGYSNATTSGSVSNTTFATSVQSDPWGIFTDNISALYYF